MGNNTIKLDWKEVKFRDMKNVVIEIKNSVARLDSRLDIAKERISKLEGRTEEITLIQCRETKRWKYDILRAMPYRMERSNKEDN